MTVILLLCLGRFVRADAPDSVILPSPATDSPVPTMIAQAGQPAGPVDSSALPTPSWQLSPIQNPNVVDFNFPQRPFQPGWYFLAETMFLHLNQGRDQGLVYDVVDLAPGNPGALVRIGPVVSAKDISNNVFEALPRLTLGYRYEDDLSIEATYFGHNDWADGTRIASAPSAHPSVIVLQTPDGYYPDRSAASIASTVHSFELNMRQPVSPGANWEALAGLRYFRLAEQFQMQSVAANSNIDQSRYDVQTANNLYGVQLGLGWQQRFDRWSVNALAKTGIYANDVSQQQVLDYFQNNRIYAARDMSASRPAFSTIQEIGINGTYQLTAACSLRAGYNLLLVNGVARVTEQLDFSSNAFPSLNSHGSALLHGPSAGIEFRF